VRLVLDTSVIVSAFRSRTGASYGLLRLLEERRLVALATPTLLFEYEEVLSRPEQRTIHQLTDAELDATIRDLAALIEPVRVDYRWRPQLTDPDDELVLEAAINGSAEAIVTHNVRDFLPAADRFRIQVLTPGVIMRARFRSWRPPTPP
jgi:putative PIN family toxin of toxin-antitoxin system